MKKYPRLLSSGENNKVIVVSETEVAKLYTNETRSEIGSEADKMQYANQINSLIVKFIRLDYNTDLDVEMLVMERLYPLDFRTKEVEERELIFEVFKDEIQQLHKAGFVHWDIKSPSNISGLAYDNVFLTSSGLRLIDVGISVLRSKVTDQLFNKFVEKENAEIEEFRSFFLR